MGRRGEGKQAENGEFLSELHPTVAQIRCFQAGQPGRNRRTSDRQVHRMAYGANPEVCTAKTEEAGGVGRHEAPNRNGIGKSGSGDSAAALERRTPVEVNRNCSSDSTAFR